jgi:UDP-3-O-[3-hydroxymyristoyl] glucosamine N-acyltransferase
MGLAIGAPLAYAILFAAVAGTISLPFRSRITAGKFPRDLADPVYSCRRIYGTCWTTVFYCKPVYSICLGIPALRTMLFRLFGYRGSMDFTIYPDTWIRDLPMLDFGEGAYIGNRATLGTNMVLTNGMIVVGRITVENRAVVGHLAQVALGATIRSGSEIGVGAGVGVGARVGRNVVVQPNVTVHHYARIGDDAVIGSTAYVGVRARVPAGAIVPPATTIPARSVYAEETTVKLCKVA